MLNSSWEHQILFTGIRKNGRTDTQSELYSIFATKKGRYNVFSRNWRNDISHFILILFLKWFANTGQNLPCYGYCTESNAKHISSSFAKKNAFHFNFCFGNKKFCKMNNIIFIVEFLLDYELKVNCLILLLNCRFTYCTCFNFLN